MNKAISKLWDKFKLPNICVSGTSKEENRKIII